MFSFSFYCLLTVACALRLTIKKGGEKPLKIITTMIKISKNVMINEATFTTEG